MTGQALSATSLSGRIELTCDFCVVGSGAGGAMAAAVLAAAGAKVVVLEEGHHHTRRDFNMQEGWAYPALYQDHGNRTTADLGVLLLQGRSVGGGTTVNWGSSFRIPERTLKFWQDQHRLPIDAATLRPHYEHVEQRLNVHEGRTDDVNRNNAKLFEGAKALGYEPQLIRRSVKGCARLGYCGMGCPLDAKQSSRTTFLADASASGATLYSDCRVVRLQMSAGKRVDEVMAEAIMPPNDNTTGATLVVKPTRGVIVAGGAINSPALLMRSQLKAPGLGTRTFLHPTVPIVGLFDDPIEGYYGPPQSVACHHFAERGAGKTGYFLETAPVHPMLSAVAFPGFAQDHRDLAAQLPFAQATIALLIDGHGKDHGGTVSVSAHGRSKLKYPIAPNLIEAGKHALATMTRILFAAGAKEVVTLHREPLRLKSVADVGRLQQQAFGTQLHTLFSAHQMGGCGMGRSGASATDEHGKLTGYDNVWVMDGSLFPSSLGVNPQLTIYALVRLLTQRLATAAR
ncbi:MAG: FAD-dependent oxidoreductase [Deltaproteobacteria bacterium]|nr:FAD-dependent oxidoreductase [Deltaproteobacteria bacterium]